MNLTVLNSLFASLPQIEKSKQLLSKKPTKIQWKGLSGSSKAFCISSIAKTHHNNHLFILPDKEDAAYFFNDLESINEKSKHIFFFPESKDKSHDKNKIENIDAISRTEVFERCALGKQTWVVSYPDALCEKVPKRKELNDKILTIQKGVCYSVDFFKDLLIENKFEIVDFVYEPGQFSIRGGIVDIFSFGNDLPYRIELFGEEVDSIRSFDPASQLSKSKHDFCNITPNINKAIEENAVQSIFSLLGNDTIVWCSSESSFLEYIENHFSKINNSIKNDDDLITENENILKRYLNSESVKKQLSEMRIVEFGPEYSSSKKAVVTFDFKPQPTFNKDFDVLIKDLNSHIKKGKKTYIFSNQPKQTERLFQILNDAGQEEIFCPINISINDGFYSNNAKIVCYTDHQIFNRYHRYRLKEGFKESKQSITLKEIYNLQKGDFVTHIDHGVGRFSGLETIDVNGNPQEAVRLLYKDSDVLYVGIHSLHRISRFSGKEGTEPKLNKLGSPAWSNLKKKTKSKLKELAFDLTKLYAKRKGKPGFSFSPDSYLQNELEASFMYEDTPDQLKATLSFKKDMESAMPMDRLICGDVGFGKTEIAIRAAFKAVADSKQVAVLVPTTLLSLQHFYSFKKRLEDFPCNVAYLNRFKTAKQVTQTLSDLKDGKIDILIGTHAIASKRVVFKDLGLIIIDEEQKFGVSVKDKLKTLRETVDTLTLTATPIPRTLQFSLMGARDLSIINTPPPNRQPVRTEIISFNEEVLQEAIRYEVSRGGQVFFVNNRLVNIGEISAMIQRLCPGVRVGVGHGQMPGKDLEKAMMGFIEGEFDVLIATTIIESGIDIPNANTIIINEAHKFGLSDLHQLRGRVGRSNKKGYCFLIAPKFSLLSTDSRKRLEALVQFSDLGSGFNIAMKDLDIRGAGNLLGAEQSGFIAEIGFEMYQKILNETMKELKENEFKELFKERETDNFIEQSNDCVFETDQEVRIPDTYVNNVTERLSLYREMDNFKKEEDLLNFSNKLEDRFGKMPKEVDELLLSFKLRWLSKQLGMERIVLKSNKFVGFFIEDPQSSFYESDVFGTLLSRVQHSNNVCRLAQKGDKLRLILDSVHNINEVYLSLQKLSS
ncbi:MAG: transcription-repair coupling factor [Crocinitomicaceae bacterium]|nr:transcription-repair coupling factor [Crocinitomicaceae bacterium]